MCAWCVLCCVRTVLCCCTENEGKCCEKLIGVLENLILFGVIFLLSEKCDVMNWKVNNYVILM